MAVPKKKVSKSRRDQRRSHHALEPINIVFDQTTGEPKLPHHVSLVDGYYKGRQVFKPKSKILKPVEESSNNEQTSEK